MDAATNEVKISDIALLQNLFFILIACPLLLGCLPNGPVLELHVHLYMLESYE